MYGLEHEYRFIRPLGHGAEGEVWRVEDLRRSGLAVTWKRIREIAPPSAEGAGAGRSVPAEYRTLLALRHPTLAPVLDSGVLPDGGGRWFTSPYFPGSSLDRLPEPIDVAVLEGLLHRALEGLAALNEAGWRHGDLKPEHLLWTGPSPWRLRIIDLGHAARLDDPTPPRVGTPPYAAPELWGGPESPGRNTDLYALAMVALEILRGGPVAPASDLGALRTWHREGDRDAAFAESTVTISDRLRDALHACLAPDPSDRPRDAAALLRRLRPLPRADVADDAPTDLEPALRGRDAWLDEAWQDLRRDRGPTALLWVGAPGIGRTRLLHALAARVRAVGGVALVRLPEETLDARALSSLAQAAAPRVVLVDDVSERDADRLVGLFAAIRALPGASPVRLVAAPSSDLTGARLRRWRGRLADVAGPVAVRTVLGLDRESFASLAHERGVPSGTDISALWRECGGAPARLSDDAPSRHRRGSDPAEALTVLGSRLAEVVSALPAPVPLPRLATAVGITAEDCRRRLENAGPHGPGLDGAEDALRVVPRPAASSGRVSESAATALLRLAEEADRAWQSLILRVRAGHRVTREEWDAAVESARAHADFAGLSALVECAPDPDARTWLGRELRVRLGDADAVRAELPHDPADVPDPWLPICADLVERLEGPRSALPFARARLERCAPPERDVARVALACLALVAGEADECRDSLGDPVDVEALPISARLDLGVTRARLGEVDVAEPILLSTLAGARGGCDPETALGALSGLCGIARQRSDLPEADRLSRAAIGYAQRAGLEPGTPALWINRGAILHSLRRPDAALAAYRRAAGLLEGRPDRALVPHARLGIGTLLRDRGELLPAIVEIRRAVRAARVAGAPPVLAAALGNLGELYLLLGDPRRSRRARSELLEIAERAGQPSLLRQARIALAAAQVALGRTDEAARLLRAATEVEGPAPRRLEAWRHAVEAEIATVEGDPARALISAGAALRDALRSGRSHTAATAIRILARIVVARGDRPRAVRLLCRGLTLARHDPAPALSRLPLSLELARLAPEDDAAADPVAAGREALRAGLAEELLIATEGPRASIPDDLLVARDRCLARLARRFGPDGVRALERRRGLVVAPELGNERGPGPSRTGAGPEPTVAPLDLDLAAALADWCARLGATSCGVVHRPLRAWRPLAETSAPRTRTTPPENPAPSVERSEDDWRTITPLDGECPTCIWAEGKGAPPQGVHDVASLAAAVRIAQLRAEVARGKERARTLQGRVRTLREESVRQRENLETRLLTQRLAMLDPESPPDGRDDKPWIALSEPMRAIVEQVPRWAKSEVPLLLWGESGVGKSALVARLARLSKGPFITENCAALPEPLLEAELFGVRAGAFTGADHDQEGLLDRVAGGTLVLDHLEELTPPLQAKLLRVLDAGRFRPLGADEERSARFRWVATLRGDPEELVESGHLRADLYYRLQGITVRVPPLRERPEEIGPLLEAHLAAEARNQARAAPELSPKAIERFREFPWPGNVRELINTARRWVIEGRTSVEASPFGPPGGADAGAEGDGGTAREGPSRDGPSRIWDGEDWRTANDRFQRAIVAAALARHGGNQTRTAKTLSISRRHLLNLIDRLGLRETGEA